MSCHRFLTSRFVLKGVHPCTSTMQCALKCNADQQGEYAAPVCYREILRVGFALVREDTGLRFAGADFIVLRRDCKVSSFAFDFLS